MKKSTLPALLFFCVFITSCHIFLGADPDNNPKSIFNSIWNDFNETYPSFELKGVNWDEIYEKYSPRIHAGMSDLSLFGACSEMLNELDDPHVRLITPFGNSQPTQPAFSYEHIYSRLTNRGNTTSDRMFIYGIFLTRPDTGYIYINSFLSGNVGISNGMVQDWTKQIDLIIQSLAHTNRIILDIRNNGGGIGANAQYIASRFVSTQRNYMITQTKNGPGRNDFTNPVTWSISPSGTSYTKPITLLTNNQTISAAERFTLALLTQNHVTHVGETTKGAFSIMIVRPLVNGWKYTMSIQKVTDINGNNFEGAGITPEFITTSTDPASQLHFALNLF